MAVQYDAFISYRHTPLDSRIAKEIQTRLERAPIPAAIRKQTGTKRINRVFRDKEELPITSDINDDITLALQNSRFLIVICSENTRSSIWVQREIDEFLRTHDISRVLTVLADGEPQDVIPETLRFREELVDGKLTRKEIEPLSCDFRSRSRKVRNLEFPRLLAVILGCSYDDLRQRQRRRRMQQLISGLLAGLILVSGIAIYALDRAHRIAEQAKTIEAQAEQIRQEAETIERQAEQIQEEYTNTLITQSRYLSEVSEAMLQTGDRKTAIQVALAALPDGSQDDSRPVTAEALYALNNALYSYRQAKFNSFVPERAETLYASHRDSRMSPDGTCWLVVDWDDNIHFYDMETSRHFLTLTKADIANLSTEFLKTVVFLSNDRIALCFESTVVCLDYRSNQTLWSGNIQEAASPGNSFWYCDLDAVYNEQTDTLFLAVKKDTTFYLCAVDCADGTVSLLWEQKAAVDYISEFQLAVSQGGTGFAIGYADSLSEEKTFFALLCDQSSQVFHTIVGEQPNIEGFHWLDSDRLLLLSSDYDPYEENLCNYNLCCYALSTGEPLWVTKDQQYIASTDNEYYWDVSGQFLPASMALGEDGSLMDVLLLRFGDRVAALHPEDGSVITFAEFPASPLTMDIGGKDRLFLTLRDGRIVQYIMDSDITFEMGSIDTVTADVAFSSTFEKYAMVKEDGTSIVFMGNQIYDADGATLEYEEYITSASYLSDDIAEYRVVCVRSDLGDGRMEYQIYFYSIGEAEPISVAGYTGSYLIDITMCHNGTDPIAYWLYQGLDSSTWLYGWDLVNNKSICDYQVSPDSLYSSSTMFCLPDGTVAIGRGQGLILADPTTQTLQTIETRGYAYTFSLSPEGDTILMFESDYEDGYLNKLRAISYPSLEETDFPDALISPIADSCLYQVEFAYSPQGNYLAYACGDCFYVIDTRDLSLVQTIPVPCNNTCSIAFLTENIVALCGDSDRMQTWNVSTGTMIMEDRFVQEGCQIHANAPLLFTQECTGIASSASHKYQVSQDGTFAREFSVEDGLIAYKGNEVLTIFNKEAIVYPTYTLDQLVEKAKTVIDGDPLSDADRIKFYIDN